MKITQVKINGISEPMGFTLPVVDVSFKVTDTDSKRAESIRIELVQAEAPDQVLVFRESADLNMAGERLDVTLQPRTAYIVRVSITGDEGDSAEAESRFETGKMNEPWSADWISAAKDDPRHPVIQKCIQVRSGLKSARLYAAGVGLFEAYVNGEKLGDEYLLPGVTNYETRIQGVSGRRCPQLCAQHRP